MSDRVSPLHQVHADAGASFTDFAGWQMPLRYGSELSEHQAVREAAGLFDLSHMAEVVVVGPQAAAALDYALAGHLSAIAVGQAKYTLLLNEHGGILDDLVVYRTGDDRYLMVANAGNRQVVANALAERARGFDCEVFDESDDLALLAVQGPRSLEVLENVTPALDGLAAPLGGLGYYRCVPARWRDHELLVARTGYTGEDGFELYLSPDGARELWTAIAETGAGSGLRPVGLAARDTLRLEAGMPLYGHELTAETLPAQAGLGRVVALAKPGGFVGQEAVAAPSTGPRLVGLVSEGRRAGRAGYRVYRAESGDTGGGEELVVGQVTSGALSPTLGHAIALAYVDPDCAAVGTPLAIDVRGTRIPARVVSLPFYQRKAH